MARFFRTPRSLFAAQNCTDSVHSRVVNSDLRGAGDRYVGYAHTPPLPPPDSLVLQPSSVICSGVENTPVGSETQPT
jgi:hypothetical protein